MRIWKSPVPYMRPSSSSSTPAEAPGPRSYYLGGIASGHIVYRRFEPVSEIEVMLDGSIAAIRYRSLIEISVGGGEPGPLSAWHLDVYRRASGGDWQVCWSQATEVPLT